MANVSSSNSQEALVPKLRFPGFEGDYILTHIGDVFSERAERGGATMELLSVTMNDGVVKRSQIEGKDNSSEDKSNYKIVRSGDLVYNSMRMWQGANGISKYDGIVSPAYTVLKAVQEIDEGYFAALFKTVKLINEFRKNSQGLTSDTWNLKYPQIAGIRICVPKLSEQHKISSFLRLLDERIDAQRRLVEALKSYKRGLSNALFERVIEFCIGSDNKRTQFSLGDLGEFYNGLTGKQKTDFEHGSEPYIPYVNVYKNMVADTSACESVSVSEREHQNKVRYGDILFTQSSETLEEVGLSSVWLGDFEPFLNSFCFGIHFHENPRIFPLYVAHYFRSTDARLKIMHEGQGITRVNLSAERIKNISIPLPQMEVQRKIGILLQCLNDKISGKQEIISQMEHLKIGLLQQLFI